MGDVRASAPKDAGTPAVVTTTKAGEAATIPTGSKVVITETEAVEAKPAQPATLDSPAMPAQPAQPATRVTEIVPAAPMVWTRQEEAAKASSGTVDTTIASRRIDAEESRPLLWAALGAVVGAGVFLYLRYPTPAFICGGAAVVFFLAWKVSGLPSWFWAVGAVALAAAAFLYFGHERGEKAANPKQ